MDIMELEMTQLLDSYWGPIFEAANPHDQVILHAKFQILRQNMRQLTVQEFATEIAADPEFAKRCCICYEDLGDAETTTLHSPVKSNCACGQTFGAECLARWVMEDNKDRCPHCRGLVCGGAEQEQPSNSDMVVIEDINAEDDDLVDDIMVDEDEVDIYAEDEENGNLMEFTGNEEIPVILGHLGLSGIFDPSKPGVEKYYFPDDAEYYDEG